MKRILGFVPGATLALVLAHSQGYAKTNFPADCAAILRSLTDAPAASLAKEDQRRIVQGLKLPHEPGKFGIRLITDDEIEGDERPDVERPYPVELPNGRTIFIFTLSGQRYFYTDSLEELTAGGTRRTLQAKLFNEFGIPYGREIDPHTGERMIYAFNSSTWDLAVFYVTQADGTKELWGAAGAMSNDKDGQPFTLKSGRNFTRQRKLFKMTWVEDAESPIGYRLKGHAVRAPFNKVVPKKSTWTRTSRGKRVFNHGYGGTPVLLPNGEAYHDKAGRYPFVKEEVWEQKLVTVNGPPGYPPVKHLIPSLTVVTVTWMDSSFSRILEGPNVILSPRRADGSVYKAAQRIPKEFPESMDLLEGAHVEVQDDSGSAIESMQQLEALWARGGEESFEADLSGGFYNGHYGAFRAFGKGRLENLALIENEAGELEDIMTELRPLFTWGGRPARARLKDGTKVLLMHVVPLSTLPDGVEIGTPPAEHQIRFFRRQILAFPYEDYIDANGARRRRILDNTGLLQILERLNSATEQ